MSVYWVDAGLKGRIAIVGRPRSGDWLTQDIAEWKNLGLNSVISLLETEEVKELSLLQEPDFCRRAGLAFSSFPIADRGVPASEIEAAAFAQSALKQLSLGQSLGVHCRAGIGRSSLIAACVLICAGVDAAAALSIISEARGLIVPDTEEQRQWLMDFSPLVPDHQAAIRKVFG